MLKILVIVKKTMKMWIHSDVIGLSVFTVKSGVLYKYLEIEF